MANRGSNTRGRPGRRGGRFNSTPRNESIKDRLGQIPTYQRTNTVIPKKDKYRFVKQNITTSSIAPLPLDSKIKSLSREFVKSYYEIFDEPGRPNLQTKYNDDAQFTFTTTELTLHPTGFGRNLLQVVDPAKTWELMLCGKRIAEVFVSFSQTKHMLQHFTYDVPFYLLNPMGVTCMQIVVTGVYEDLTKTADQLSAFTRIFLVKQVHGTDNTSGEPRFEIFNDLFMLQRPTSEQIKKYHSDQSAKNKTAANQSLGNLTPIQEGLIHKIMNKTGLTRAGAIQLLQDTNWIEEEAMKVFVEYSQGGLIPQDLFIKKH